MPIMVAIYVNNLVIISSSIEHINQIKTKLLAKFNITDLKEIKNLLGIEILRLEDGSVFIHQNRYLTNTLTKYSIQSYTPYATPIVPRITANGESVDIKEYQSLRGSLMWPSLATRPDIYYTAKFLGHWNAEPRAAHMTTQKRVMRYIKGTTDYSILYNLSSTEGVIKYSDLDYGGDLQNRKSTTSTVFTILRSAIT
jgi:hypothetical protein